MEYRNLGRSGLQVSVIGLGCMPFGMSIEEEASAAIVHRALELGINFFDTADIYGDRGKSEVWLGRALGKRRPEVVIATKFAGPMSSSRRDMQGGSRRYICAAVEASLQRLGTDYIDLYQMHHVDRNTPWEEIWQAMEQLVREGKVLYVGSSNFAGWHIAQANEAAKARHFMGLVSEQSLYNLNARMVELEVIPACEGYGLGLIPWSPLAGGLLGGVLQKIQDGRRASERVQAAVEKHRAQLEQWEAFCADLGEQPADVALAWLLGQTAVTAPIIGPRTLDQLTGSLRALEIKLSAEDLAKLDAIWPGPGGAAPEAYAW